ncbi:hypothetical protein N5E68_20600, partial [Pseudomonas sp. GD03722]
GAPREKWGAQHPGTDRSVEGGVYGAVTTHQPAEWQGDLWIALRDMPRFAPPSPPGERSLCALLNRWWR